MLARAVVIAKYTKVAATPTTPKRPSLVTFENVSLKGVPRVCFRSEPPKRRCPSPPPVLPVKFVVPEATALLRSRHQMQCAIRAEIQVFRDRISGLEVIDPPGRQRFLDNEPAASV